MYEKTEFLKVKIRLLELEKDFKILKDRESRGGNKKDMEVLFFEPINVSIDDTEAVHGSIPWKTSRNSQKKNCVRDLFLIKLKVHKFPKYRVLN